MWRSNYRLWKHILRMMSTSGSKARKKSIHIMNSCNFKIKWAHCFCNPTQFDFFQFYKWKDKLCVWVSFPPPSLSPFLSEIEKEREREKAIIFRYFYGRMWFSSGILKDSYISLYTFSHFFCLNLMWLYTNTTIMINAFKYFRM